MTIINKIHRAIFRTKKIIFSPYIELLYQRVAAPEAYTKAESWGRIIIPDNSKLLASNYHFNPTIEFIDGCWLMAYRIVTSAKERELAICQLDENFQPKAETNINLSSFITNHPEAQPWHADPRFFKYQERLFISYNDQITPFLLEICTKTLKPRGSPKKLEIIAEGNFKRQAIEKNWQFFVYGQQLYVVYKIAPHIVLKVKDFSEQDNIIYCQHFSQSRMPSYFSNTLKNLLGAKEPIGWNRFHWGEPRGGTSPVLIKDTYFSFFHTVQYYNGVYSFALYGFEAQPPFNIKYISKQPIIYPKIGKGNRSELNPDFSVLYPCGAVYDPAKGLWYVSCGLMDKELRIIVFDHQELLNDCQLF